jgi:hypothetical protein
VPIIYLNIVHVIFNYYGEKDVIHYLRPNYRYVTDSENNRVQVFATDYYSEKNVSIHPIFMSIKFHHYKQLMELTQSNRLELKKKCKQTIRNRKIGTITTTKQIKFLI